MHYIILYFSKHGPSLYDILEKLRERDLKGMD